MKFACEVADAKAMGDTVQGIEDMVGSANKREKVLSSWLGMNVTPLKSATVESSTSDLGYHCYRYYSNNCGFLNGLKFSHFTKGQ